MPFDSVMLDFETLGTNPATAPVLQVAAVAFDSTTGAPGPVFRANVDVFRDVMAGAVFETETVEWWRDKYDVLERWDVVAPSEALGLLTDFVKGINPERIWAQGMDFDLGIARAFFDRHRFELPWSFRIGRDTRTIYDEAQRTGWEKPERANGREHNAVHDCLSQIACLASALRWIRGERTVEV